MIDFRIPKDPLVMKAMARYLMDGAEVILGDASLSETEAADLLERHVDADEARGHVAAHPGNIATERFEETEADTTQTAKSVFHPDNPNERVDITIDRSHIDNSDAAGLTDEEVKDIAASVPPPAVELDSDGLPWDARIHAGSKAKLAKSEQWKKKRGVTGVTLEQVEAELRDAMAASPERPVGKDEATTDAAEAFGSSDTETVMAAPGPDETASAAPVITNFAELNIAITSAGIPMATVTAAVNQIGLTAYPLLAARPDLIEGVVTILFPED